MSEIIRGFKTFSSKNINIKYGEIIFQWQKSFFDHIIRNENSLYNIRQYILNNPLNWNDDENNIN
ncbi:MAG: transposase [Ignavibacteriae bacterium]|nr:transposase [Ignavibacteriota bacterium]